MNESSTSGAETPQIQNRTAGQAPDLDVIWRASGNDPLLYEYMVALEGTQAYLRDLSIDHSERERAADYLDSLQFFIDNHIPVSAVPERHQRLSKRTTVTGVVVDFPIHNDLSEGEALAS
jgi:hypothetical protein